MRALIAGLNVIAKEESATTVAQDGVVGKVIFVMVVMEISEVKKDMSVQQKVRERSLHYKQVLHLCTAVAWREKVYKHFVFFKYFCLVLGLLKSRISEKTIKPILNKPNFKLFHGISKFSQCSTMKLNKRSLPKPTTTTG